MRFLYCLLLLPLPLLAGNPDSLRIVKAVKYIKEDPVITAAIKKQLHKQAVNFAVSDYLVDNYHPLRYFDKEISDSIHVDFDILDSLTRIVLPEDRRKISYSKALSVKQDSKYSLYCSLPVNDMIIAVLEYDGNYNPRRKYMGIGRQPFMVLFHFGKEAEIKAVFYGCWILD